VENAIGNFTQVSPMSALQTRHERQRETERERERERERGREGGRNGRKKNFIISCDSKGDERGRNCRAQNAHTCICIYMSYRAQCTALREIYAALNLYIIYIYIYIHTHIHTQTYIHTYISVHLLETLLVELYVPCASSRIANFRNFSRDIPQIARPAIEPRLFSQPLATPEFCRRCRTLLTFAQE